VISDSEVQVTGSVALSVRRTRRAWRVLVTFEIAGREVVHFGPEYATEDAALSSLEAHMVQVIAQLDKFGLKHEEPRGYA
jgi:hypothetical protein